MFALSGRLLDNPFAFSGYGETPPDRSSGQRPRSTNDEDEQGIRDLHRCNYQLPPPPPNVEGNRDAKTTWHHVMSFNPGANNYLRTLKRGATVFVEANFEVREPDTEANPDSPQGQRQLFLRHESIRVLRTPRTEEDSEGREHSD
ncbi:hypothetical protein A0H81_03688 [Grifola frondosa]|uniref:Single-stranded DNA-binding protein rim1, mitochondrial n=1 Tax=Grifola frondosa TaxID=5627 RepID=A0A1C7MGZ8_GRIFR|nr:hypothetical protein A0H81_03688 [Grifola frondosa]